jgi:hypothetical protein
MLTAIAMFTIVAAGCGASLHRPRHSHLPDPRPRRRRELMADRLRRHPRHGRAHAAVGVVGQAGGRCQDQDYKLELTASTVGVASRSHSGRLVGSFAGCSAKKPSPADTWSCTVDLLKSERPAWQAQGLLRCAGSVGKATTNLAPTRTITYAAVPPKPVTTEGRLQKWNSSGSNYVEVDKIAGRARGLRHAVPPLWREGLPQLFGEDERSTLPGRAHEAPAKSLELIKTAGGTTRSMTLKHRSKARCAVARSGAGRSTHSSCEPTTPMANPPLRSSSAQTSATSAPTDRRVPVARPTIPCHCRCCRQDP